MPNGSTSAARTSCAAPAARSDVDAGEARAGRARGSSFLSTRGLLYSSIIYGAADVVVLAVGGLFLIPLYTRTLSQTEFGNYVIVRTNAELFTYLLYFGLPSAAARVYFDHRKIGRHVEYMRSVVNLFMVSLLVFGCICYLWGGKLWELLSPNTPTVPNLWFSVAIAAISFFATLGPLWLRLENRVHAFVTVQICASLVLALAACVALVTLHAGLFGLVAALLISSAASSLVLPWLFGGRFRPAIEVSHVSESLRFAAPVVVSYVAYFVLNRTGTVILQRHVAADQIAIFGLAQQLAMMVTMVGTAFGKAMQPAVYAAEPVEAEQLLRRSGHMLILLMFGITSLLMLFGWEGFSLVAPSNYAAGFEIFLILAWANLAYSFNLISSTALFYNRRPKTSVAISILGAVLSAAFGLWLIPQQRLQGAAFAAAAAFFLMTVVGQWVSRRLTGHSHLGAMLLTLLATAALAALASWFRRQGFSMVTAVCLKSVVAALACGIAYAMVRTSQRARSCNA
jgi:O-antigen/teichoic acid export membrane protein